MRQGRKKRIGEGGDISLGATDNFSVSIGNLVTGNDAQNLTAKSAEQRHDVTSAKPASGSPEEILRASSRIILRREASGRSGRVVTIVEIRPSPNEKTAAELAKIMRKGLGCGSHVELPKIILQGDIKDRVETWLTKQGVKKIVMGN